MSFQLDIRYRLGGGPETPIELEAPYHLFGTHGLSKEFWGLPRLREIGMRFLPDLGHTGPIYFVGWGMLEELAREIDLLRTNLRGLSFYPECVARWLCHLVYAHALLILTAPVDSEPILTIG